MSSQLNNSGLMTPEQRLLALELLEERQRRSQRVAVRVVWGSVVTAGVVLAFLIGVGSWRVRALSQQEAQLRSDVSRLNDEATAAKDRAAAASKQAQQAEEKQRAIAQTLATVPEAEQKAAVERSLAAAPQNAALLPRIYMQIVDPADRPRAEKVRAALRSAGYIVLGIETRTDVKGLQVSDVRYYRESESDEAKRIAAILENAGEERVKTAIVPERYRNSPNVRPNHFEVWLAPQA